MRDVDLGCRVSREETIKELILPDPVSIIPCWRHRISTVQDGGVIPGHDPCDEGLYEDCQCPVSLLLFICNNLEVDMGEVIPGRNKIGEEEGNIHAWDGAQLSWRMMGSVFEAPSTGGSIMVWLGLASILVRM